MCHYCVQSYKAAFVVVWLFGSFHVTAYFRTGSQGAGEGQGECGLHRASTLDAAARIDKESEREGRTQLDAEAETERNGEETTNNKQHRAGGRGEDSRICIK